MTALQRKVRQTTDTFSHNTEHVIAMHHQVQQSAQQYSRLVNLTIHLIIHNYCQFTTVNIELAQNTAW